MHLVNTPAEYRGKSKEHAKGASLDYYCKRFFIVKPLNLLETTCYKLGFVFIDLTISTNLCLNTH